MYLRFVLASNQFLITTLESVKRGEEASEERMDEKSCEQRDSFSTYTSINPSKHTHQSLLCLSLSLSLVLDGTEIVWEKKCN